MRRFRMLLSLMAVALVGILAAQTRPVVIAQEVTPASQAGVTFEAVAFASSIPLPAAGDLSVARISFAPGTGFPMAATDPVHGLAVIERGELTLRAGLPLVVTRAGALGTAMKPAGGLSHPGQRSRSVPVGWGERVVGKRDGRGVGPEVPGAAAGSPPSAGLGSDEEHPKGTTDA